MAVQWPPWSGGGSGGGVESVNGDTGPAVVIDADDVGAVPTTSTANRIYATNASGDQTVLAYSQSPNASSIAQRGAGGSLQVGTPTAAAHATRKDYVDGLVAGLATDAELAALDSRVAALEGADFVTDADLATALEDYVQSDGTVTDLVAKTVAEMAGITPDATTVYAVTP